MNRHLTIPAFFMALMMISCAGETVSYSEPTVNPPSGEDTSVREISYLNPPAIASAPLSAIPDEAIAGFNDFSFKFYLASSKGNRENLCVSPMSVGSVLAMIANGDDGDARNEILRVMGFEEGDKGLDNLNSFYQTLISNLPNIEDEISCNITNSIWCDPAEYRIINSFRQNISDFYYATHFGINPSGESGREVINRFVSINTKGLIDNFLSEPLNESITLAFLNTVFFKAGWTEGFSEYMTSRETFVDIDCKQQETDFMFSDRIAEYAMTDDGTEAVRLNYGKSERFSMTLILPSSRINHIPLDEVITPDNLRQINSNMKPEHMFVWLPKFEVGFDNPETIDILKSLGMEKICSNEMPLNFSNIIENNSFQLNFFAHSTKLKVDENGTEAAAVSLGGMSNSVPNEKDIRIAFNRPFVFFIQENTTGTVLFIGAVKTFS